MSTLDYAMITISNKTEGKIVAGNRIVDAKETKVLKISNTVQLERLMALERKNLIVIRTAITDDILDKLNGIMLYENSTVILVESYEEMNELVNLDSKQRVIMFSRTNEELKEFIFINGKFVPFQIAGPKGERGPKGEDGKDGMRGEQGPRGFQGVRGADGERGQPGPQGPAGQDGEDGKDGTDGAKGKDGAKGETGPQGPQGLKGEKGDTGPAGKNGSKGDTGPQGLKGEKGDTGPQGLKGEKGDKGDTGPAGKDGEKGEKGDTGPRGPQGLKGEKGDTGPQGEKGEGAVASVDGILPDANGNVTLNHANKTDVATALNDAKKYTDEKIGSVDFTEIENSIADNTSKINAHEAKKNNPHSVTKSQVGLGSVDNVKQASKEEHDRLAQSVATHLAEDASTTKKGHVQLNDNTNSTSITQAATANAVKTAYDRAVAVDSQQVNLVAGKDYSEQDSLAKYKMGMSTMMVQNSSNPWSILNGTGYGLVKTYRATSGWGTQSLTHFSGTTTINKYERAVGSNTVGASWGPWKKVLMEDSLNLIIPKPDELSSAYPIGPTVSYLRPDSPNYAEWLEIVNILLDASYLPEKKTVMLVVETIRATTANGASQTLTVISNFTVSAGNVLGVFKRGGSAYGTVGPWGEWERVAMLSDVEDKIRDLSTNLNEQLSNQKIVTIGKSPSGTYENYGDYGLVFKPLTTFILKSVVIDAETDGVVHVRLTEWFEDMTRKILPKDAVYTKTLNVKAGAHRYDIEFLIPSDGKTYFLSGSLTGGVKLMRVTNTSNNNLSPYCEFINGGRDRPANNNLTDRQMLSNWYWFFDWEIDQTLHGVLTKLATSYMRSADLIVSPDPPEESVKTNVWIEGNEL